MFVCFEGIDGVGKTTQARMLAQRLKADGVAVELVADPGTTRIGTAIRQILLQNDEPISVAAQMLLFSAARAELAAHIQQRLAEKIVVICDRWLLSTLVYQGEINNISVDLITHIFKETAYLCPEICFLLDLEPEKARSRAGDPRDRYERFCLRDRERMRAAYKLHAKHRPYANTVQLIDADRDAADTHEEIYKLFCRISAVYGRPVVTQPLKD